MIKYFMISLIGIIVFMNGYCIKKGNIGEYSMVAEPPNP